MINDLFKPEHFAQGTGSWVQVTNAEFANRVVREFIEACPVVYAATNKENTYRDWSENNYAGTQLRARLAFIEEIKKECVNHDPEFKTFKFTTANNEVLAADFNFLKCKHCNCELQATWSEKK